jgi:hypothetical protein
VTAKGAAGVAMAASRRCCSSAAALSAAFRVDCTACMRAVSESESLEQNRGSQAI